LTRFRDANRNPLRWKTLQRWPNMFEFRLFDFGFALAVPDKASTAPSVGR
jgi:hypothetical protein